MFLGISLWDTFIMWQLHFLKNAFLKILEIRYLILHSNYVRKYGTVTLHVGPNFWINFLWYVCITYWNKVAVRLQLGSAIVHHFDIFLLRHNYVIFCSLWLRFLMTLELRYILVRSNYLLKLRYKMVIFQLRLFVSKKWWKNT